ncbi:hypothetical protein BaRGS_00037874 [Batillaria attramentaria]|uniref:Sterile alpha motif domain-containing protein 9-like n=1 Tax=Batillaria attramentaria TaxID=370345 RepID=A0ABD0J7I6_9CAEN
MPPEDVSNGDPKYCDPRHRAATSAAIAVLSSRNGRVRVKFGTTVTENQGHWLALTHCAPAKEASGVAIAHADSVVVGDHVVVNYSFTEAQTQDPGALSKDELLITLINYALKESEDEEEPLHSLEQIICRKLSEVLGKTNPSFQSFYGLRFREFLEKNKRYFTLTKQGRDLIVSKSKDTENVWQKVRAKENTQSLQTHLHAERPSSSQDEKSLVTTDTNKGKPKSVDECFIEAHLNKRPDDTLIFRPSDDEYKHDRVQFTLDVVSLWNTPHRSRAYIIIGVRANSDATLPHEPVGLKSSSDDDFYQSLFLNHLYMLTPKFSYREVAYRSKLFGIIQIEHNHGCGFPSVVLNNDMAPRLQENQLWARRGGQNILVPPSDFLAGQIYSSFLTPPHAEVSPPAVPLSDETVSQPEASDKTSSFSAQTLPNVSIESTTATKLACVQRKSKQLVSELNDFQKGHFVLVCGSLDGNVCRSVEALSYVPWIAVYDFDFMGRESGLLNILEDSIKKRRSLTVSTWRDPQHGITERATQWWSLRGRRDVPDSNVSDVSHKEWLSSVRSDLEKVCVALERFSEDYTVLTILLLWPSSELEARCMHEFLRKLKERVPAKLILCFTDEKTAVSHSESNAFKIFRLDFEDLQIFEVNLGDLCLEIELLLKRGSAQETFQYQLPSEDPSNFILTEEDAAWLKQDLEVLYLQGQYTKKAVTADDLKAESEKFYRGGSIDWYVWYDMGAGYLDVERSLSKEITKHIREFYISKCKSGVITVFHAPGSGGSTMAQRILWNLHETTPCVQVMQRSGSSMEEIAHKLRFLHERTQLPVIALMDGEDEPRLTQLNSHLQRNNIITLYVKRYSYDISESRACNFPDSKFYLSGVLKKQESRNVVMRYTDRCASDMKKVDALKKLDNDVQEDTEKHQLFEYGMTVYDHEFRGVTAYVKGYLQLDENNADLEPWQKCLGFLSLVYFYGQVSLPIQFFCALMGKSSSYILGLDDFPYCFRVLVARDTNEGRHGFIRICHYLIAKEILEQMLNVNHAKTQRNAYGVSKEAKKRLKSFCISFISYAAKKKTKRSQTAQNISHIMAKTFIFRDNRDVGDYEPQDKQAKNKFSQIMSDVDSQPPFSGRLEVLQKLCSTFPDDPNFRAHIGRFYTFCRPEEEDEAEKHFEQALKLCQRGFEANDTTDSSTLVHIYHMYGMAFQRRVAKYTGWKPEGKPQIRTKQEQFEERFEDVIYNATRACEYFMLAKHYTPIGLESCYTYLNVIHVRLQACDFVNRFYKGRIQAFLAQKTTDRNFGFIKDSVSEVQDLIMECYNVVLLDNGAPLQMYVRWFTSLFGGCIKELESFVREDDLASLRLKLTVQRIKLRRSDNIATMESSMPAEKIDRLVKGLEDVLRCVQEEDVKRDTPKNKLELDYKDWIFDYSLERVLEQVRQWHDSVHSPQSTFYIFVLQSLLGLGTSDHPGNTDSLVEAQILLEEKMQKLSRTVVRPKWPREWLGREDQSGIRRLVPSSSLGLIEDRVIKRPYGHFNFHSVWCELFCPAVLHGGQRVLTSRATVLLCSIQACCVIV